MPQLLDQYGRPIQTQLLKQELAAAEMAGVRQVVGTYATGIDPARLAQILRSAGEGDPLDYLELAEQMEEKDLHYLGVISTRKRAVAQLDITVEAASDEQPDQVNADLVRDWIAREGLEEELFDALDAIGKGFSVTEILWEMSERQWWPGRLVWRDPRWFEFDRVDGTTPLLRRASGPAEPLAPWKFLLHTHKAKSGLPIRGGLARIAAWAFLFKNYGLKDWVTFGGVYGMPVRVGKYGPSASPEDIKTLLRAVSAIGSDAAAVIPQSMTLDFINSQAGAGADVFQKLCDFLDQQVSKGVLGQTTTTDAISGGHAVSKEHQEVRYDILDSDARQLAGSINRDLVRPLVDLNRGPQKAYPKVCIRRREAEDVDTLVKNVTTLVPFGLRVEESVMRDKLGLPDPPPDARLLTAPAAPAAADPFAADLPPARERAALNAQDGIEQDAIDALAARMLAGWDEANDPLLQPLIDAVEAATDPEDLQRRLAEILARDPQGPVTETLARGLFAARAAGELGVRSDGTLGS